MFSIDNIFFTVGGQSISGLEFCSVVAGLSCVFLATRGKVANFWIGYLYNILLFMMFSQKHLYSVMLLQPVSLLINLFGHYRWTHPKENEKDKKSELKITLLSGRQRAFIAAGVVILAFCWGFLISRLNIFWPDMFPEAKVPFLDAAVTVMILLAQLLSAQKRLDCWAVWLVVNIMNGIMYIKAGLVFMPIVAAGYLVLAIFGFKMWRAKWIENK
jgi:nicotinamide mononucleotide transporter